MGGLIVPLFIWLGLAAVPAGLPPLPEESRDQTVIRGIAWLRETVEGEEWSRPAGLLGNSGAKQRVVEAVLAYLLLLYPDLEGCDSLERRLDQSVSNLAGARVLPLEYNHFANWVCGFSSLYLMERAVRGKADRAILENLARGMEDRQNAEGGWGHGSSLGLDFYPSTLVVTTYWALFALGGCREQGVAVDEEVLEDGLSLLRRVQAPSGGFPYGGPYYRKGIEAGRTSGVVLALTVLGEKDADLFRNAVRYLRRNIDSIPDGHASPAIHVLTGALAARVIGEETWKAYQSSVLDRIVDLQQGNGGFGDIVPSSPDSLEFMGGDLINEAYRTALYCAALSVPRSRLVARILSKGMPQPEPLHRTAASPQLEAAWSGKRAGSADRVVVARERCGVLGQDGLLTWHAMKDGSIVGRSEVKIASTESQYTRLALVGQRLLVWSQKEVDERVPRSIREYLTARTKESSGGNGLLACYSLAGGDPLWQIGTPGFISLLRGTKKGIYVLDPEGVLDLFSLEDGSCSASFPRQTVRVNKALAPLGENGVAISSESRLFAYGADGELRWKRRLRGKRGITPPAYTHLTTSGPWLYTGSSDGTVSCRTIDTGDLLWSLSLDSSVRMLSPLGDRQMAALTWDRSVHGISDSGKKIWTCDVGLGNEHPHPGNLRLDGRLLWVSVPARERLCTIDSATGAIVGEAPLPADASWDAGQGRAVVGGEKGASCFIAVKVP